MMTVQWWSMSAAEKNLNENDDCKHFRQCPVLLCSRACKDQIVGLLVVVADPIVFLCNIYIVSDVCCVGVKHKVFCVVNDPHLSSEQQVLIRC